ncbi:non-ribosomal peptide synthetase [Bacillus cereus group sp. BfR-BA-01538]|uniref:non-ribosomal peptide synthetase n=1 Tax=Bacillus cereus group sp. BfR-BA-01538 TaxID=2920373 RepID=UPI001F59F316
MLNTENYEYKNKIVEFPVSGLQSSMWLLQNLNPDVPIYNINELWELNGDLDIVILEKSLNKIIERHQILRTIFQVEEGELIQKILPSRNIKIPLIDMSELPYESKEVKVKKYIRKQMARKLSLKDNPPFFTELIKIEHDKYLLLITIHHIITDGWSMELLAKELMAFYTEGCIGNGMSLETLPLQFKDFILKQKQNWDEKKYENQLGYWENQLCGELPILQLPTDYPRTSNQTYSGEIYKFKIPKAIMDDLQELSLRNNSTVFMSLLAIFNILLFRYANEEDIIIGSPIANRNFSEAKSLMGPLMNTLVYRNNLSGNPTFIEFLKKVRKVSLEAFTNHEVPWEAVLEKIQPKRDTSVAPVFQVMFVFQNTPVPKVILPNLDVNRKYMDTQGAKHELTLIINDNGESVEASFQYNINLFNKRTMERMAKNLINLIKQINQKPEQKIGSLSLLSDEDREKLLVTWNDTKTEINKDLCIHTLFEEQVASNPDAIALTFEDKKFTYDDLNRYSNQMAHFLEKKGVRPEKIIGIYMEDPFWVIVVMLGILKAGGAYLPIDSKLPDKRINYMIEDANIDIILTASDLAAKIKQKNVEMILIDKIQNSLYQQSTNNLKNKARPNNLAYVIYTSGSTGYPKGVMVEHQGVCNLIEYTHKMFKLSAHSKMLQFCSFSFDVSVFEIFSTLTSGAQLYLIKQELKHNPEMLMVFMNEKMITHAVFTPSVFSLFESPKLPYLKYIVLGGEICSPKLSDWIPNRIIYNGYGPTEATVFTTMYRCKEANKVQPIGKPISNVQVFVLDDNLEPVTIGVPGQLYIGGIGLARGYLNRDDLTKEKFIKNPFSNRKKDLIYKTGDLVRYLPNGDLEYIGRLDKQVKIRGFRIELEEIESVLKKHPKILDAVVIDYKNTVNDKQLAAYVVVPKGEIYEYREFKEYLLSILPYYMVPDVITVIDKIPLTNNKKVDTKSLPDPVRLLGEGIKVEQFSTNTEFNLALLWRALLKIDRDISRNDNFFELGGQSLNAFMLAANIREKFKVDVPLNKIFQYPYLHDLARYIERLKPNAELITSTNNWGEVFPVTAAQYRMYIAHKLYNESLNFNMPTSILIEVEIDKQLLELAIKELINRHQSLRTKFELINGVPFQKLVDKVDFKLHYHELNNELVEDVMQRFAQAFILEEAPLFRAMLIKIEEQKYLFLMDMHHIISDGISIGILLKELAMIYKGEKLPRLGAQYKEFVAWEQNFHSSKRFLEQEKYWLSRFTEQVPEFKISKKDNRKIQYDKIKNVSFEVDQKKAEILKEIASEQGVSLFMLLLSIYNILLSKISGQTDVVVGTAISGRREKEFQYTVGLFINTIAIRNKVQIQSRFSDFLQEVKKNTLSALDNQEYPFNYLVKNTRKMGKMKGDSLFNVWFEVLDANLVDSYLPNSKMIPFDYVNSHSEFDLRWMGLEQKGNLTFVVKYKESLFKEREIVHFIEIFNEIIKGIVGNVEVPLRDLLGKNKDVKRNEIRCSLDDGDFNFN